MIWKVIQAPVVEINKTKRVSETNTTVFERIPIGLSTYRF